MLQRQLHCGCVARERLIPAQITASAEALCWLNYTGRGPASPGKWVELRWQKLRVLSAGLRIERGRVQGYAARRGLPLAQSRS